jgi:Flp pilus assembly pilin Flp
MMTRLAKTLSRFRRDETGSATIEFVLYFTVLFVILATSVEIANMNLRHAMLERGVDIAVRDIRLSTGAVPTYEEVRQKICEEAEVLDQCSSNLMIEMKQVDPEVFVSLPDLPDCINAQEEPRPVRQYQPGMDNDLMLMRVCFRYKPILPTSALAKAIGTDEQGYAKLIVRSAFVQEPR